MPRRGWEWERKFGGEMFGDRETVCAESGKSTDGASELEDEGAFAQREEAIAMTEESVEPAGDDEAEGGGKRLLEECASDDGSVAVFVSESGERVTECIELGENYVGCGAKLEDQGSVDGVLTCGAPMDEAGGVGVLFGDELSELLDEGNRQVGGDGNGGGKGVKVEKFGMTICGDYCGCGGGNEAGFGFCAGEGGLEIKHDLERS